MKLEGRKKPLVIAWIHSHVRGSECSFSSIDNHTQHSFSKLHKGVLGLVIEIKKNGQKGSHDFFELTQIGRKTIERCSRQKNCISNEQHDSCNGREFYQSAYNKVIFDPSFSLKVRNFMSINVAGAACLSDWDMGDFEEDIDDLSEVEENEFKTPQPHSKNFQSTKDETCKICQNKFSNLLLHLSRWSEACKDGYGDEFEKIKKMKEDEQRAKKRKLNSDSYERKKKRQESCPQDKEAEKERKKQYNKDNPEVVKGWNKRYYTRNADKIRVHNYIFNKDI